MGVEIPERAEYLRVIWHELSRIHSHRAVAGSRAPTPLASRACSCTRWTPARAACSTSSRRPRGGRVDFVGRRRWAAWSARHRGRRSSPRLQARARGHARTTTTPAGATRSLKDSCGEEPHRMAWAMISQEGCAGPDRWWARSRAPPTWTTTCACWATAATRDLADFQPIRRRPKATATPAARCAALEVHAVHRHHRGDDRQDSRTATSPVAREGLTPADGAEAANVVEQPRGECVLLCARQRHRSTSTACACARRRRRTWPAWRTALAGLRPGRRAT